MKGISSVTDSPRPGQAHRVVTPEPIAAVEVIMKENRRVTVNEIAAHLAISHGSAHHIVHDVLQFHKVSARWMLHQLTTELKERHDASQELLKCFEAEGDGFLGRIVTGDETWVHYYMQYMPRGNTVTSATYADLKNHLHPAVRYRRQGSLSTGVLLRDSIRPHTAHSTVATIQDLSFKCLPHLPYLPDLASSDFPVFGPLKEAMGGKSFKSNEEVQQAVQEWLHFQPREFFF